MSPHYNILLALALAGFALQILSLVYFFAFFRGGFEQWKQQVNRSLERLESVFFRDVEVTPHPAKPEPVQTSANLTSIHAAPERSSLAK